MISINRPFITIVVATFNASNVLSFLLESIASQAYSHFEVLIQDGASADETVDLARSFQSKIPHLIVNSEPDLGIYDAWNKAVLQAKGEWVLFLGADDRLYSNCVLLEVVAHLSSLHKSIDFFATSLLLANSSGLIIDRVRPSIDVYSRLPSGMSTPHPSLFYRSELFVRSKFDTSLRIAGDYDFLCRNLKFNNYCCRDSVTTIMSVGGMSASLDTLLKSELECLKVSCKHFHNKIRYPLYARIVRSAACVIVMRVAGENSGKIFADTLRALRNKPPLWTTMDNLYNLKSNSKLFFSLLIATIGRKEPLEALLQSLVDQSYKNFEILIADQNPPYFLAELIERFREKLSLRRILIEPRGVSYARNVLLSLAGGDIVAFPDDDCWYAPHALERIQAHFNCSNYGGLLVAWSDTPKSGGLSGRAGQVTKTNAFRDAGTLVQFYRKEAIDGIRFDLELGPGTGLPYGCGEDTDFLIQVLDRGVSIARTSEVLVYHGQPDPCDPILPAKAYKYGRGRMRLLHKHRFSPMFKIANVLYPLLRIPLDPPRMWHYRCSMFLGRFWGYFRR